MIARAFAIVFSLLLTAAAVSRARACSCSPSTIAERIHESTAIFAGRVVTVDAPDGEIIGTADAVHVGFEVVRVWKGPAEPTLTLETMRSDVSCGYVFEVGRTYLVYAVGTPEALTTGLCLKTRPLSGAQDELAELGAGEPAGAGGRP